MKEQSGDFVMEYQMRVSEKVRKLMRHAEIF